MSDLSVKRKKEIPSLGASLLVPPPCPAPAPPPPRGPPRTPGGGVVGPRSNSTLLRVFDISLSLSLSLSLLLLLLLLSRESCTKPLHILSVSVSVCLSVCVLPSMSSSILAPSLCYLKLSTPLVSASRPCLVLSASVCFVWCVFGL